MKVELARDLMQIQMRWRAYPNPSRRWWALRGPTSTPRFVDRVNPY